MKRHKIFQWATVIAAAMYCAGACQQKTARAEFVAVDWSGDYIPTSVGAPAFEYLAGHTGAANGAAYLEAGPVGILVGRSVDDFNPYNPPSVNYQQPTRLSSVFYGGHVVEWSTATGNPGFDDLQVENKTPVPNLVDPVDYLHMSVKPNAGLKRYAAFFYWKKDNFTNGFSDPLASLEFSDGSEFSLTSAALDPFNPVTVQSSSEAEQVRWVVRNGTQFYISTQTKQIFNKSFFLAESLAKSLTWKVYNPFGSLGDIFYNSANPTLVNGFTDITALGFYISSEDGILGNDDVDLLIKQFQVTANLRVVPEPGFAMVGLFGAGLFAVRRLKNRKSTSSVVCAEDSSAVAQTASV